MNELFLICALSLAPASWFERYTEADRAFFAALEAMSPAGEVQHARFGKDHQRKAHQLPPGGFLIIDGPYGPITAYFQTHAWMRMPLHWKGRQIWRKPGQPIGGSA